jgi:hypothetical protein
MVQSAIAKPSFSTQPLPLEVHFDLDQLTSDGGLLWLLEADDDLGLSAALATAVREWRRGPVRHPLAMPLRQRILQIACGYPDQHDATTLRHDPLFKLACGQLPASGAALASQATLSRLDTAADAASCAALADVLLALHLRERSRHGLPTRLLLDFDSTDDPTHGQQDGSRYHGYYGQHMYHPLLVFDGDTNQLISARLRPGNAHASWEALEELDRIVTALRHGWSDVPIEVWADGGFAVPALYAYCEQHGLDYTIGLIPNARLAWAATPLLVAAQYQRDQTGGEHVRFVGELSYQADSWAQPRRVAYKAEVMVAGTNMRFVVTTRSDPTRGAL